MPDLRHRYPRFRALSSLTFALLAATVVTASVRASAPTTPPDNDTAQTVSSDGTLTPASADADTPAPAVTPPDTREVLAEGRAAIGPGGLEAARKTAIAYALRNAVEKTTGVYVSAHTLTHNYQLVRDQVITHSDGFATPEAIVREVVGTQQVRIVVRALVSLRPLAKQLKALNLTRAWRVRVVMDADGGDGSREAVATSLERALTEAGFVVVSSTNDADIIADVTRRFDNGTVRPSRPTRRTAADPPFAGSYNTGTIRSAVTIRATLAQTGEVIAALNATASAQNAGADAARADAAGSAAATLAPKLTDALMLLPAREAQPVELIVGKIGSAARAVHFENTLNTLPGITSVIRRRYENGNAIWELQVLSDSQSEIARDLEENPALKPYHLAVLSDTLVKIVAATNGVTPVFKPLVAPAKHDPTRAPVEVASIGAGYAPSRPARPFPRNAGAPQGATCVNPIDGETMVWIPSGPFAMGDNDDAIRDRATGLRNNPRHTVYLAGYYISRNLVTVGEFRKFCNATRHQMPIAPPWGWQDDHPIVNVTWDDARAYCDWAGLRLPTEAEWEKAARGNSGNRYPWGNTFDPARLAFGNAESGGTAPVGAVPGGISPYGVLDMSGNVWEWCADWYQASYLTAASTHPFGARPQPRRRVLRGGSWHDEDESTFRSAYRSKTDPQNRSSNIGFRTVSEPW